MSPAEVAGVLEMEGQGAGFKSAEPEIIPALTEEMAELQ